MQKKIIKFSILLFIIFFIGVFFLGLNKSSIYDTKDLIGQSIKDVKLKHFYKKKIITDIDLSKNNFTLINFWASWCAPCRKEHVFLLRLSEEDNIRLLGVNFKDNRSNALKFLNELGDPYDYLTSDESGTQSVNFGIYGIPESILINSDLKVIKKFIGPISENDFEYIKEIIKN